MGEIIDHSDNRESPTEELRPRDLAVLLLACTHLATRQRVRDQQADQAGLDLKRQILDRLIAMDPHAYDFEMALGRIVDELGQPTGPSWAIATGLRDDWEAAARSPEFVEHLLAGTMRSAATRERLL